MPPPRGIGRGAGRGDGRLVGRLLVAGRVGAVDGLAAGLADELPTSAGSVVGRWPEFGRSGRSSGLSMTTGGYG
jgi:hypothetical protein